ncbi:hypothetical protein RB195_026544 [Necator americanus]|uniref:Uncharacterized protein n=1 Tax=Necator americanus TaxID=51031 RepID=A0ABR1EWL3_NECAM
MNRLPPSISEHIPRPAFIEINGQPPDHLAKGKCIRLIEDMKRRTSGAIRAGFTPPLEVENKVRQWAAAEDLLKYTRKKILEAAQRTRNLKKYRRDLREYIIPLAVLLSEDGTLTFSRREMEIITERFHSNLLRSSTPVSSPIIPTGEAPPRTLPSEVRVAIKSIKPGTAPGPDFISADFLRAGGHPLHVILAAHVTFYL